MVNPHKPTLAEHTSGHRRHIAKPEFLASATTDSDEYVKPFPIILFTAAHILLALFARQSPYVAVGHALLTFAVAGWLAFTKHSLDKVVTVSAYVMAAEVFWRMSNANRYIPWESGKYAVIMISLLTLLRMNKTKIPSLQLIYFLLLLPSTTQTLAILPLEEARQQIAFNLSGALAFFMASWFFSNVEMSLAQLKQTLIVTFAPIASIATLTLMSIITTPNIDWKAGASNIIASAWSGANQTSAVLGIGTLFCWLLLLFWRNKRADQAKWIILGGWFTIQGLLTFSRGGIFTAGIAAAVATFFLLANRRKRVHVIMTILVVLLLFVYALLPQLNELTGGSLLQRFTDLDLTGRDTLMRTEIQTFQENTLWGIGPGMMKIYRAQLIGLREAAHTEYTRMLAEHGLFGVISLILLFAACWRNFWRLPKNPTIRGLVAAFTIWGLLFMAHTATRIVAPSWLLGLSFITIRSDEHLPSQLG